MIQRGLEWDTCCNYLNSWLW